MYHGKRKSVGKKKKEKKSILPKQVLASKQQQTFVNISKLLLMTILTSFVASRKICPVEMLRICSLKCTSQKQESSLWRTMKGFNSHKKIAEIQGSG